MKDPIVTKWEDTGLLLKTSGLRNRTVLAHSLELIANDTLHRALVERSRADTLIFPIVTRIVRDNGYKALRSDAIGGLYNDINSEWEKYVTSFGSEEEMNRIESETRVDLEAEFCALYVNQRGAMFV